MLRATVTDDEEHCREAALRLLDYRSHGKKELENKLVRRGYSKTLAAGVAERLVAQGLIDDVQFAAGLARGRLRKQYGRARVENELRERGLDASAVAAGTASALEEVSEHEMLVASCRKKLKMLTQRHGENFLSEPGARNKVLSYLLSRGYAFRDADEVLRAELRLASASEEVPGDGIAAESENE